MKTKKARINTTLAMIKSYFPQVEGVKDATRRAVVEVTDNDNNNSQVKSHLTCALAIACKRAFHADGCIIGLTTSWIINGRTATRYMNAATVSREITSFDRNAGFDAGLYLLSPATAGNRIGMERSHNPHRKRGNGRGAKAFRHFTRNVRTSLHGAHKPL